MILQDDFNESFGLAVGISNINSNLISLLSLRVVSVNSGTGRENNVVTIKLLHHLQERDRSTHVVLIVL